VGTRNRQRRAEKRRRHERSSGPRREQRVEAPPVREMIYAAAGALGPLGPAQTYALLELLTQGLADELRAIRMAVPAIVGARRLHVADRPTCA